MTARSAKRDRYAVIGNPIAHSLSPDIHALFAAQTGELVDYQPMLAPVDQFEPMVNAFFADGGKGLNITVPFKQLAYSLADERTPRAEQAQAVNTFYRRDEFLVGDNTDGVGLLRDLTDHLHVELAGARVLLIGAGGAARGVLRPLIDAGPAELVVVNRTLARAAELALLAAPFGKVSAVDFDHLSGSFDLVVNATSASLGGFLLPLPADLFTAGALAYDMVYAADGRTTFLDQAQALGATRTADGLGMLVEQAAEAFFMWRDQRPKTRPVLDALRQRLASSAKSAS